MKIQQLSVFLLSLFVITSAGQSAHAADRTAAYSVTPRLDASRAVWKDIPTTGGEIAATAADGTLFTLTIPPDALLSRARITMTPLTAVDGLPLSGGLAGAVDLAPAGLRLFQMATLKIVPAVPIVVEEQVTFAWRGDGTEFFLYPPELDKLSISMKLMHFSGYGVGRGTAADQAAQQLRVPTDPEDALSQRLQKLFADSRRASSLQVVALDAPGAEFYAQLQALLRSYYDSVLAAEIEIGRVNCEKGKIIFPRALGWIRTAQLAGVDEAFDTEVENIKLAYLDFMVNCYDEAFEKCVDRNDPAQVVELLSFLRQLQISGASDRVDESKVDRCSRFELDFESVIEELQPSGPAFAWRHQVRAIVPVRFSPDMTLMTGNADLRYTDIKYIGPSVDPCTQTSVGSGSVFQALSLEADLNVIEGKVAPPPSLTLKYDPGYPELTFTIRCPEAPPVVFQQERWRSEYYVHHHSGELSDGGFAARDWSPVGGAIWARKTYQINSGFAEETTIMNLKHTPEAGSDGGRRRRPARR